MKKDTMVEMKRFAVTGSPVLHSKSPVMFNAVFMQMGLEMMCSYGRLAAGSAGEAIGLFKELGLAGMNVTAPFKKEIMEYLDEVNEAAVKIGGVNTVVRDADRLKGFNTDYTGVTESLKHRGISLPGKRCVVLGAGGAGRAAVYGLIKENANVTLVNRTYSRALQTAENLGCLTEKIENLRALLEKTEILVSTLSADIDVIPEEWLKPGITVFDANYKKSILSQKAAKRGCSVVKGEEWLLNQAIPAFRYFMGDAVNDFQMEKVKNIMQTALSKQPRVNSRNIALVGFMGCGKTAVGKQLAQKMGLRFRDIDQQIEEQEGRSVPGIFARDGETYFRKVEKSILTREVERNDGFVYSCGGGAVLDEENKIVLKDNALVIWLYSSISSTIARLEPGSRPLLDCPNPTEKARELLTQRLDHYSRSSHLIVGSEAGVDDVSEKIYEEISKTFHH
jgi:shikimate dehydrogenase